MHDERQLDDRTAQETIAFGTAQAECDIDGAILHLRGLFLVTSPNDEEAL